LHVRVRVLQQGSQQQQHLRCVTSSSARPSMHH
jgi:hypothetical protein